MAPNATSHDAASSTDAAPALAARILHLPITTDAEAFGRVARASERVLVRLPEPRGERRRELASVVVDGVESELDRLGAAPRGWAPDDSLEEIVRDQLYRARLLGCFGVAVSFAPLTSLADAGGRLSPEDSETLHRLLALAEREPLQLHLPRPSVELLISGAPLPLAAWLPPSLETGRVATIEYDPASEEPGAGTGSEPGEGVTLVPPPVDAFVDAASAAGDMDPARAMTSADAPGEPRCKGASASVAHAAAERDAAERDAAERDAAERDAAERDAAELTPTADHAAELERTPIPPAVLAREMERADLEREPERAATETPSPPPSALSSPADAERAERCLAWAAQLQSMSGPKVHGSIEKAFIGAYLPLRREIALGGAPEPARKAAERWAEGFAQSYAAAFRQLSGGARRPRMVRDVVEIGARWLGQYHARQCQLLLVSAMRFDLGQRLNEQLELRLANRAFCVDQTLLWTALPSNEAQQLGDALGSLPRRGRAEPPPPATATEIESGYVGSRELFRLRQLPAELASPGEVENARLDRLATELADTLAPWIQRQPPDTLVVIFGDHGFHWEASALGTSMAQRGGALPDQVLVPASGWLLRETRPRPKTAPGVH